MLTNQVREYRKNLGNIDMGLTVLAWLLTLTAENCLAGKVY